MESSGFSLRVVDTESLARIARTLFAEYAALPHTVGRWPTAAADIAALPTPYVRPAGMLLVAVGAEDAAVPTEATALGCGALAAQDPPTVAEIKRLYVRPTARKRGIGETLTRVLIDWAGTLGYTRVRLDTAPELHEAIALYHRLGFTPIAPYRPGLLPDALCFERPVKLDV
jgi:GNAT superfamily N-acetyltransferase